MNEFDLLDQLETAVQMGSAMTNASQRMNALRTDVELLDDSKEFDRIKKFIVKSRAHNHRHLDVWEYGVKNIFRIRIPEERTRYEINGKQLGKIRELFHGSRNCNILSILKGGLIIPPSLSDHVTGRLFGDGLYFANNSTKSLNYSTGWWARSKNKYSNVFLFLADVAMGNEYVVSSYYSRRAPKNYNSLYAKKNSQVLNAEFIAYSLSQATLTYLVEMKR